MSTFHRFKRWLKGQFVAPTLQERLAELEHDGMLRTQQLVARRSFLVEEFEDEGPHLFLELSDGSTLYMGGQGLYDYGPNRRVGDGGFPSTEFTLVTHRVEGYIVSLECTGNDLAPEHAFPPYQPEEYPRGLRVPAASVELLEGRSYEALVRAKGRLHD